MKVIDMFVQKLRAEYSKHLLIKNRKSSTYNFSAVDDHTKPSLNSTF
jgi:hypothetical protein